MPNRRRNSVGLPEGVVEDILARLPTKHVLRCKLLSKTYRTLINNPRFVNKHMAFGRSSPSKNNHILTVIISKEKEFDRIVSVRPYRSDIYVATPLFRNDNRIIRMVGSCNGLLCALVHEHRITRQPGFLLLWNPATRDHIELPPPIKFNNGDNDMMLVSPFDHYHDAMIGFGYDARSDDYKLVMISYDKDGHVRVQIWSMRTNSWREVEFGGSHVLSRTNRPYWGINYKSPGILLRGKLYWAACHHGLAIISFDLANDSGRMHILDDAMAATKGAEMYGDYMGVFDFNGSLAFSVPWCNENVRDKPYRTPVAWVIDIWVMVGDDDDKMANLSTWAKFSIGPVRFHTSSLPRVIYFNDKLVIKDRHSRGPFILYDLRTKVLKRIRCDRHVHNHDEPWCYTESLVSLPNMMLSVGSMTE